jgi:hypothetical protein
MKLEQALKQLYDNPDNQMITRDKYYPGYVYVDNPQEENREDVVLKRKIDFSFLGLFRVRFSIKFKPSARDRLVSTWRIDRIP